MSPQQTPLVTWSLINAGDVLKKLAEKWGLTDSLRSEAVWGADYIMRNLSPQGYFYMTIFSYFNKDPEARRVVGLHANSVTTDEYQCAFREGGGMAIAALARISRWKRAVIIHRRNTSMQPAGPMPTWSSITRNTTMMARRISSMTIAPSWPQRNCGSPPTALIMETRPGCGPATWLAALRPPATSGQMMAAALSGMLPTRDCR
jgi:hypothetical protein